jgi:cyclic pyranopterin phosphate synthase
MPQEGLHWKPRSDLLTYEETSRLVETFAGLGVHRIRLTGGEPTVRSDIRALVSSLAGVAGIDDLSMTTNAHSLDRLAEPLADAGLDRVNVSLDSLNPATFERLTRGGNLDRVLAGIQAARAAGLTPIKINTVLLQDNQADLLPLVDAFAPFADDTVLRFIEYMPFEARWHESISAEQARGVINQVHPMVPESENLGGGPARYWRLLDSGLRIGFIAPLSEHFCGSCNRLRLSADGQLRTCLSRENNPSLRDLARSGASSDLLEEAVRRIVLGKPLGHGCLLEGGTPFEGRMTAIGG